MGPIDPDPESLWQAALAAERDLEAQGVPEDDPRMRAVLGELDRLEGLAGEAHMAKVVEERTVNRTRG